MSTEVPLNAGSQLTQSLSTDNLQKPASLADSQISSEYQRSYSWKLPFAQVNKPPKAPSRSEYQREFTWKQSPTPSPSTPVNELLSDSKSVPQSTPQSTSQSSPQSSALDNKSIDVSRLTDISVKTLSKTGDGFNTNRNTPEPKDICVVPVELNVKQNGTFVTESDIPISNSEKFTSSAGTDKWKDTLRNGSNESNFDSVEKKMVVLEGSRLSKKSRCRSMYSLKDQLKVKELASQYSGPYETEYRQQFVDWMEYYDHERKPLQRRGSWSAPLDNFRSLDGYNRSDSKSSESRKLQPSPITDVTSVKSNRDHNLIRPSTSAEYRNYRSNNIEYYDNPIDKFSNLNLDDYNYSSSLIKNNEMQRIKSNELQKIKSNEMQKIKSVEMQKTKSSGSSPLRNSVYNHDDLKSQPETSDYRRRNTSNIEYPGRPRNRDTHMDERRRDYEHLYDNKQDTFYSRKDDYDEGRHNKSHDDRYNNHLSDTNYNYYVTERQLDNGFDVRNNINNIQKRRDHNEYDKYTSSRSSHISDKDPYGRYANQSSSNGHSRNTSYSSTNDLDSSRSNVHSPLPAVNPSYLDHIRHRATASDSSSVSTPSSPPTPNGFYDDDPRLRKSNGLDPRIYKDQIYSPAITSRPLTPRSNFPLEDDKDRYYRSSPLSPSYNKFHLDDNHRQSPSRNKFYLEDGNDYDDISHNYISSKRQPLLSSTLKDKPLTAKSPTPSIPRSYQSAYLSPPVTRATSPTRSSYTKKHHNYHYEATSPTLSPTYSSRPPSRATSVSSHATSIEEESVALTDILQAADSLTLRNLSEQLKIFRHREFSPPSSVKSTSRSTPGTRRPSVTTTKNSTNTTRGIKSSSAPDYTLDKRSQPTDFSAAREALNRAKLKVEEMLELVSNNGSV